jgi:hypothetical protein
VKIEVRFVTPEEFDRSIQEENRRCPSYGKIMRQKVEAMMPTSLTIKQEMYTRGGQTGQVMSVDDEGVGLELKRVDGKGGTIIEHWAWDELELDHLEEEEGE